MQELTLLFQEDPLQPMQMVYCAQVQERLRGEHKPPHPAVNFNVRGGSNISKEERKEKFFFPGIVKFKYNL